MSAEAHDFANSAKEVTERLSSLRSISVQESKWRKLDGNLETHFDVYSGEGITKHHIAFTYERDHIENAHDAVLAYLTEVYALDISVKKPKKHIQVVPQDMPYANVGVTPLPIAEFEYKQEINLSTHPHTPLGQYSVLDSRRNPSCSRRRFDTTWFVNLLETDELCFIYYQDQSYKKKGIIGNAVGDDEDKLILPVILNAKLSFGSYIETGADAGAFYLTYRHPEPAPPKPIRIIQQVFDALPYFAVVHAPGEVVDWSSLWSLYQLAKQD